MEIDDGLRDLSSQSEVVIRQLMERDKLSRGDAVSLWYKSRTKRAIEEAGTFYISGMRCYWELTLELANDPKWMKEPIDF